MNVKHVKYINQFNNSTGITAFYANTEKMLPPGHVSGPIIRDCYIIQYVREGKGVVQINNNIFSVSAGQAYVVFPGAVTTMTADKSESWAKSWICLHGDRIRYFLDLMNINEENPIFAWKNKKEVLNYIHFAINELKSRGDEDELNRNICGNELFKILLRLNGEREENFTMEQKQSTYIVRALQFIEYNVSRAITVDQVAAHVGLNRTYFSTLFKEKMKVSPHQYLIDYKIKKACEYFENPNSTVASVGTSIGYEPQVFSRLFKTQTGLTPREYTKKIKG